jgi:hypothetical protein
MKKDPKPPHAPLPDTALNTRKYLLAKVAAHVAGSVMAAPSQDATSAAAVAEISVDVAEAILQRVGL